MAHIDQNFILAIEFLNLQVLIVLDRHCGNLVINHCMTLIHHYFLEIILWWGKWLLFTIRWLLLAQMAFLHFKGVTLNQTFDTTIAKLLSPLCIFKKHARKKVISLLWEVQQSRLTNPLVASHFVKAANYICSWLI